MKTLGNIFFLLLFSFFASGQNNIILSGILLNETDHSPIIACGVELLQASDSALVANTISGDDGSFFLKNLVLGEYILRTSCIGYHPLVKNISLKKVDRILVDIGKLYLKFNDASLQETIIEEKMPAIIIKKDTIEYNVSSYVDENAVVNDLLKKLPGVKVSKDGKITVNGKEVKYFLMNNKKFFLDDLQIIFKNFPVRMIEKLQVIERKSDQAKLTGIDDGEEEIVINLSMNVEAKTSTIGDFSLSMGSEEKNKGCNRVPRCQFEVFVNQMENENFYTISSSNNNTMIDLGKEFSSVFSLNSGVYYNNDLKNTKTREIKLLSESRLVDSIHIDNTCSNDVSTNFQLEYKPDMANTLVIRPNVQFYHDRGGNKTDTVFQYEYKMRERTSTDLFFIEKLNFLDTPLLDSLSKSENKPEEKGYEVNGTLNYEHKFHKPGRVFSLNVNYTQNRIKILENIGNSDSFSWTEPLGKNNFLHALYCFSHQSDTIAIQSSRSQFPNSNDVQLNFKAIRNKYNYTIGINPSYFINNLSEDSITNLQYAFIKTFRPVVTFNYIFGARTNLRFDYKVNYEAAIDSFKFKEEQLDPSKKNLEKKLTNALNIRFNQYIAKTQLMYNIDFESKFLVNDEKSWNNSYLCGMFNVPLKDKRFFINDFAKVNYANKWRFFTIANTSHIYYQSDLFDMGLDISTNYYSKKEMDTYCPFPFWNIGVGGDITCHLPNQFILESDINSDVKSIKIDKIDSYKPEWNITITKQLFNYRLGIGILKLQVNNILGKENNSEYTVEEASFDIRDIPRSFTCGFIYKIVAFSHNSHSYR